MGIEIEQGLGRIYSTQDNNSKHESQNSLQEVIMDEVHKARMDSGVKSPGEKNDPLPMSIRQGRGNTELPPGFPDVQFNDVVPKNFAVKPEMHTRKSDTNFSSEFGEFNEAVPKNSTGKPETHTKKSDTDFSSEDRDALLKAIRNDSLKNDDNER